MMLRITLAMVMVLVIMANTERSCAAPKPATTESTVSSASFKPPTPHPDKKAPTTTEAGGGR